MALLPPSFLDTVVAIGVGEDPNDRHWVGTGFIFGELIDEKKGERKYQLWLITNKHVLVGYKEIYVKFNSSEDTDSKDYFVPLKFKNGRTRWIGHPIDSVDVAALWLNPGFLQKENRRFDFFKSDFDVAKKEKMVSSGITEGDNIFVLGFPMGLVDRSQQYVICRGGCIARIRDYLENLSSEFLIDSPVFPGNSGGPVIYCPTLFSVEGTKPLNESVLIGIVKSYVPYSDLAYSRQTNRPRIIFEENSGLAAVESTDSIIETVEVASKRIKQRHTRRVKKLEEQSD